MDVKDTWHAMLEEDISMCPLNIYGQTWEECEVCNSNASWCLQTCNKELIICSNCLLKINQ